MASIFNGRGKWVIPQRGQVKFRLGENRIIPPRGQVEFRLGEKGMVPHREQVYFKKEVFRKRRQKRFWLEEKGFVRLIGQADFRSGALFPEEGKYILI